MGKDWIVMMMKAVACSLALLALPAAAASPPGAGEAPERIAPRGPAIDSEAEAVLRAWSDYSRAVETAVFRVIDSIDDVQPDGQKIQFSHIREFTVVRPDKLKVVTTGDVRRRILWKDGKTLTVLDVEKNVYAQLPDPGTIAQAIDELQEKYGMSLPAADLLAGDVYETVTAGCDSIDYIGKNYAGEELCDHLAFTRKDIDWQIWVSTGDQPLLRKVVITYKEDPGEPQYTMRLLKVGDAPEIHDEVFDCEIPEGAERITFHPVEVSP